MLSVVDLFDSPIFVSGCQRSGTTVISRAIRQSQMIADMDYSIDDELEAAYILSGEHEVPLSTRYCFQTTYVNECYYEYKKINNKFSIIWVIRNPYSVVYSMVYNWARYPLNELFFSCGLQVAIKSGRVKRKTFSTLRLSAIEKACYSYCAKNNQIIEMVNNLNDINLMVIDYDHLVSNKVRILSEIYEFLNLPFQESFAGIIHAQSIEKSNRLSEGDEKTIKSLCEASYNEVRSLLKDKV